VHIRATTLEEFQAMAKVIKLRPTKKAIYRAAVREMEKIYQMSSGGSDPIIDESTRELFESGLIDEVKWLTWSKYCRKMSARLEELTTDKE